MVTIEHLNSLQILLQSSINPLPNEEIDLFKSSQRILAEDIYSTTDLPPFNRSTMDGYAVKHDQIQSNKPYKISETLFAGTAFSDNINSKAIGIATGASVPKSFDTVIPQENTELNEGCILFKKIPPKGSYIHTKGQDKKKGDTILKQGTLLQSHHLGVIASLGISKCQVQKKPIIKILTTGDEVSETNHAASIYNSNHPMIHSFCEEHSAITKEFTHLRDDRERIRKFFQNIPPVDLLITTGGAGNGPKDFLIQELSAAGNSIVRKFGIKPGGPTSVWELKKTKTLVLSLAGNPFSALIGLNIVGKIIFDALSNRITPPFKKAFIKPDPNPHPERIRVIPIHIKDTFIKPIEFSNSGDLTRPANGDGLALIPSNYSNKKPTPYISWQK